MLTSADIEWALTHGTSGPYNYRRALVVANVSWGLLNWEADMVALSVAGWLTEIEIKISVSDLKRDLAKDKHKRARDPMIRDFYYAMPLAIWEKVSAAPPIPEYAGVWTISDEGERRRQRKAAPYCHARKLTDSERLQLARLGAMRYWSRMSDPDFVRQRKERREAEARERMEKWNRDIQEIQQ